MRGVEVNWLSGVCSTFATSCNYVSLVMAGNDVFDAHLHVCNHLCIRHLLARPFGVTALKEPRTIVALGLFAQPGEEGFAVRC